MKLSPHFTLEEACKSQVALRLGIDNSAPPPAIARMRLVAERILEPVRNRYSVPIVPSSWFRCPALNEAIGSKNNSQHTTGDAVDFEVPGQANPDVARWISDNLDWDQMILEFFREGDPYSGWIHCSYVGAGNRRQILRYNGKRYQEGLA